MLMSELYEPRAGWLALQNISVWSVTGLILSRIYNCTKPDNRNTDNAETAHFTLHISILQLHKF